MNTDGHRSEGKNLFFSSVFVCVHLWLILERRLPDPRFGLGNGPVDRDVGAEVAEAAVVPAVDEVKGRVPVVYISLKPGVPPTKQVQEKVNSTIETIIGKIARPKNIHMVPDMPKTRSGKIMRRVLAAISNHMDTGDITTLANPDIVEQIRVQVQGRSTGGALKEGPEDIKRFGDER